WGEIRRRAARDCPDACLRSLDDVLPRHGRQSARAHERSAAACLTTPNKLSFRSHGVLGPIPRFARDDTLGKALLLGGCAKARPSKALADCGILFRPCMISVISASISMSSPRWPGSGASRLILTDSAPLIRSAAS